MICKSAFSFYGQLRELGRFSLLPVLKTKGISDIERAFQDAQEVVISVRGKPRFVVMELAQYDYLRKCEIAAAWVETREDVAAGRYRREEADAHVARSKGELADEQ